MTLLDYMKLHNLKLVQLARDIGRPVSTVHGWVYGRRRPDWADIPAIEKATKGAVRADDFVPR